MFKHQRIEKINRSDKKFAPFFSLKNSALPDEKIVIESEKVIEKAIASNQSFDFILCSDEAYESKRDLYKDMEVFYTSKTELEGLVGYNLHHGHFALIKKPKTFSITDLRPPILVLNGLTSTENIGAIARNCSGFGVESLVIDETCASPFSRRATRVSMGCIFNLKICESNNIKSDLITIKENGVQIVSTAIRRHSKTIDEFPWHQNLALIIGSEGHGINEDIEEISDEIIYIPMKNNTEALNAACSSAVFLSRLSYRD